MQDVKEPISMRRMTRGTFGDRNQILSNYLNEEKNFYLLERMMVPDVNDKQIDKRK